MLHRDPALWEEDEAFRDLQGVLKGLAVVDDRAKRGVALIQDLNKKLTKDEDQLKFLLQVVSKHRRQFHDCSNRNITLNKQKAVIDKYCWACGIENDYLTFSFVLN